MPRCFMLKNYFDSIWVCSYDDERKTAQGQNIVPEDLRAALTATARKRGTEKYLTDAPVVLDEVEADVNMKRLWQAYQRKFSYAEELSWHTVTNTIRRLYELL